MANKDLDSLFEKFTDNGWIIPKSTYFCLSDYEKLFLELEFTGINSFKYYENRLKELGFINLDSVIDIGGGMGQWAISMSKLNKNVVCSDIRMERLFVAKDISNAMLIKNLEYKYSYAEKIPYADKSFDGIFCYGVFMFTDMPKTLKEFYRVLKPGGKLYLNANSLGWHLHLMIDRGLKKNNFVMAKTAIKTIIKTIIGRKRDIVIFPSKLKKMLLNSGFKIKSVGPEGTLTEDGSFAKGPAKYESKYYGYPSILEVLACK